MFEIKLSAGQYQPFRILKLVSWMRRPFRMQWDHQSSLLSVGNRTLCESEATCGYPLAIHAKSCVSTIGGEEADRRWLGIHLWYMMMVYFLSVSTWQIGRVWIPGCPSALCSWMNISPWFSFETDNCWLVAGSESNSQQFAGWQTLPL